MHTPELIPPGLGTPGNAGAFNGEVSAGVAKQALEAFKTAVRLNPDYAPAYCGWGTMCLELGNYTEAIRCLEQARRLDPGCLPAWSNLILAAYVGGQRRLARRLYRKFTHLDASDPQVWYFRSLAASNCSRLDEAIGYYWKGWELAPDKAGHFGALRSALEKARVERLEKVPWWRCSWSGKLPHWGGAKVWVPKLAVGVSLVAGVGFYLHHYGLPEMSSVPRAGVSPVEVSERSVATQTVASYQMPAHDVAVPEALAEPASEPAPEVSPQMALGVVSSSLPEEDLVVVERAKAFSELPSDEAPTNKVRPEDVLPKLPQASQYSLLANACAQREALLLEMAPKGGEVPQEVFPESGALWAPRLMLPLFFHTGYLHALNKEQPWDLPYNLKLGPMTFNFSARAGIAYNDNIALSNQKKSDMILSSGLGIKGAYPVTDFNILRVNFDFGFKKYLRNSELDTRSLTIDPASDSQLDFEVQLDDLTLRFYDDIELIEDPFVEPSVSGVSQFRRLTNTLGVDAVWDKGDLNIFGNLHRGLTHMLGTPNFDHLNSWNTGLSTRVSAQVRPWVTLGLVTSMSWVDYWKSTRGNSVTRSLGPDMVMEVGDHMVVSASLLRSSMEIRGASSSDTDTYTGNMGIRHEINRIMNHSFRIAHTLKPALQASSNTLRNTSYIYAFGWSASDRLNVSSGVNYNTGMEEDQEAYKRMDLHLGFDYLLSPKTTANVNFGHAIRWSDSGAGDYRRNLIELGVTHRF